MVIRSAVLVVTLLALFAAAGYAGDVIGFDFETGDLQGFEIMEGKFGMIVSDREMCRNTPGQKHNKQGKYFLGTLELPDGGYNDSFTGIIESPVFKLTEPRISFLIGGGSSHDTYVALCVEDGTQLFRSSGKNSEIMIEVIWDARDYVGKKVYLAIVDKATGGWGHVTFDDFKAGGIIDSDATAGLRASYAQRKSNEIQREKALLEKYEAESKKREKMIFSDEYLFPRGAGRVYREENLGAVSIPIGGIGSGCIQMDGKARLAVWQIFNNYLDSHVPHSFFAVYARQNDMPGVVRALQTEDVGQFPAVSSLKFRGEYPFGWYEFEDKKLPVKMSMEVFNPLVPLNSKDSGIPCAVFNITAENNGAFETEVSIMGSQQNAVGYSADAKIDGRNYHGYGGNWNRIITESNCTVLHMAANMPDDWSAYGDMALAALAGDVGGSAGWDNLSDLYNDFDDDGAVDWDAASEPSPDGETVNGALVKRFKLKPGEKRTITFVLAWYFPNAEHGQHGWGGKGNMYTEWYPSALHVILDLQDRLPELAEQTRLYHDTLYKSNLPWWLIDRISSQVAVLRSRTCFWTKDGYFGGWEGCCPSEGCCAGNCSHVWHYAQAHARLFPDIGRRMREQEFAHIQEDGGIPHRQIVNTGPAADGQYGGILASYREHLISRDDGWLKTNWPNIKRAMEFAVKIWDADEDGILSGYQWNTLDDAVSGSTSWMGTLYLASLRACEKMANLMGEPELAKRYAGISEKGSIAQNETLWNGEYYIQIPGAEPIKDYNNGCHIDQLLGQWWANQLNLGSIYPEDRMRTALDSLVKYNFHGNFFARKQAPRKFVDDNDAALQMITWPHGGRPEPNHEILYADEVMTGFEYAAAATMVQYGMLNQGYGITRAIYDRYDGRLRTDVTAAATASWGYTGNPFGDDECGKFYARAMSVWSLLLASQGYIYDGPAKTIGFKPVWKPEDHSSFFTAAEGYGLFEQRRSSGEQAERITVAGGKLDVAEMIFQIADGFKPSLVTVTIPACVNPDCSIKEEREVKATYAVNGNELKVKLASPVTLSRNEAISVIVK